MIGDLFGRTIDGDDVEAALLAHLQKWMPSYLGDAVRIKDPDAELWPGGVGDPADLGEPAVLPVREYTVKHAAEEKWPEEQLPMLLAHCPGFGKPPTYEGDGTVTGYYLVNLSAIASGASTDDTKKLARVYSSAAAKVLNQKPDLGGFANETQWMDSKNMRPPGADRERNIMSVVNVLLIEVPNIFDASAGPEKPLEDPGTSPGERPTVKEGGGSADIRPGAAAVERLREGGHFDPEDP
jgi:hypothetical protein